MFSMVSMSFRNLGPSCCHQFEGSFGALPGELMRGVRFRGILLNKGDTSACPIEVDQISHPLASAVGGSALLPVAMSYSLERTLDTPRFEKGLLKFVVTISAESQATKCWMWWDVVVPQLIVVNKLSPSGHTTWN